MQQRPPGGFGGPGPGMGGSSPGGPMMQRSPMPQYSNMRPGGGMPSTPGGVKRPMDSRPVPPPQQKK
jgi:hypothetical protein